MNIIAVTWALSDISRPPNILNTGSAPLVLMLCEMLSCGWGTTSHPSSWSRILSSAHLHHTLPSSNCVFDGWAIARISEIPPKTSIQPFEGELLINAPTGFPRASHMCALAVPWRSEFPRFSSFKNHPENIFENGGGRITFFLYCVGLFLVEKANLGSKTEDLVATHALSTAFTWIERLYFLFCTAFRAIADGIPWKHVLLEVKKHCHSLWQIIRSQ